MKIDKLYDTLIESIMMEEDNRLFSMLDDLEFEFRWSIRISGGREIIARESVLGCGWLFAVEDRRRHVMLMKKEYATLLDGVEEMMAGLGEKDALALWRKYLENENGGRCNEKE